MRARRAADRRVQHGQDREHRDRARGAGRDRRPRVPGVPARSRAARARPSSATASASTRVGGDAVPFPGALHLWESEYLLRHPPTRGRAVDGDHDGARADRAGGVGVLPRQRPARRARRRRRRVDDARRATARRATGCGAPLRWFDREFAPALGIDVFEHAVRPATRARRDRDAGGPGAAAPPGEPRRGARRARPVPRARPRRCRSRPATRRPRKDYADALPGVPGRGPASRPRCSTRPTSPVTPGISMPIVSWNDSGGAGPMARRRTHCADAAAGRDRRVQGPFGAGYDVRRGRGAGMDDSDKGDASRRVRDDAAGGPDRRSAAWSGIPGRSRPTRR